MFAATSDRFVNFLGDDSFIPLNDVEEAQNCQLLNLVVKHQPPDEDPEYALTDFPLQSILKSPDKGK